MNKNFYNKPIAFRKKISDKILFISFLEILSASLMKGCCEWKLEEKNQAHHYLYYYYFFSYLQQ
jgi:hypothetical protein